MCTGRRYRFLERLAVKTLHTDFNLRVAQPDATLQARNSEGFGD
jgi:hypothetical protein